MYTRQSTPIGTYREQEFALSRHEALVDIAGVLAAIPGILLATTVHPDAPQNLGFGIIGTIDEL